MSNEKTPKFNVGDIVRLKSGGPDMTISGVVNNIQGEFTGSYVARWFAGKKSEKSSFPEETLEKASE